MTSKEVMALLNASIALNGAKNQLPEGLRIRKALNDSIIDGNDEEVGEDIEETNEHYDICRSRDLRRSRDSRDPPIT
jgi:hypothetical protein